MGRERQWPRLCERLGLPELVDGPALRDQRRPRRQPRRALRPILAAPLPSPDLPPHWLAELDAAEIPAGPINDVVAAFAQPQAQARGMTVEVEHPVLGALRQVGIPFHLAATPATIRTAPPLLGEHTARDPRGAGLLAEEIAALAAANVT